jgi:hypothetical protein
VLGVVFAGAQVADLDGRAYRPGGDVVDQIVAVLDLVACDGGEDVAGLDAGLGGSAVGGYDRDDDSA